MDHCLAKFLEDQSNSGFLGTRETDPVNVGGFLTSMGGQASRESDWQLTVTRSQVWNGPMADRRVTRTLTLFPNMDDSVILGMPSVDEAGGMVTDTANQKVWLLGLWIDLSPSTAKLYSKVLSVARGLLHPWLVLTRKGTIW